MTAAAGRPVRTGDIRDAVQQAQRRSRRSDDEFVGYGDQLADTGFVQVTLGARQVVGDAFD
ncbi:hypothetical protein [Nocardia brevicatena]|uniref:hypothetical protein n=1 Tax=Nocardia brevicatena TaxID=37327 RepID=UPI000594488B|nr:hypothetical protein [Nocardia brevicatena]